MAHKTKKPQEDTYYLAIDDNGLGFIFSEVPTRFDGCWMGVGMRTTAIFPSQIEKHLDIGYELTFSNNPRKITNTERSNLERY